MRRLKTLRAGVAVGSAGVQNDSPCLSTSNNLLGPENWICKTAICREHRGHGTIGPLVYYKGNIKTATGFQPSRDSGGYKALRPDNTHGATPIELKPTCSVKPRAMFMH